MNAQLKTNKLYLKYLFTTLLKRTPVEIFEFVWLRADGWNQIFNTVKIISLSIFYFIIFTINVK